MTKVTVVLYAPCAWVPLTDAKKHKVVTSDAAAAAAEANCLKPVVRVVDTNGPLVEVWSVVEQAGEASEVLIVWVDFEVEAPKPEVPFVTVAPESAMVSEPLVIIAEYFTRET